MTQTLQSWLQEQPFTLTLSSGFFGFFAHSGLLAALDKHRLLPNRLTGSSAGALVGAMWAAGVDTQTMRDELFALSKEDFWDPGVGLGLLKGQKMRDHLQALLPVKQFEDCRVPLSLSTYDPLRRETVIFNQGDLIPALYASCAVPFMFQPIRIDGRLLWDGGVSDRPALADVSSGERVCYHHIASRSPWRRAGSEALQLPTRDNLISIVLHGLARPGPSRLEAGKQAWQQAFAAAERALEQPVLSAEVQLAV